MVPSKNEQSVIDYLNNNKFNNTDDIFGKMNEIAKIHAQNILSSNPNIINLNPSDEGKRWMLNYVPNLLSHNINTLYPYAYAKYIVHAGFTGLLESNGEIKKDFLEENGSKHLIEQYYKFFKYMYNIYPQSIRDNNKDFYYVFRHAEILHLNKGDKIIQPIPFSTSYDPLFSLVWGDDKVCCLFIIKVPLNYPVVFLSSPLYDPYQYGLSNDSFSSGYINQGQREITLPPSVLKINNIISISEYTLVFCEIDKMIPFTILDKYLTDKKYSDFLESAINSSQSEYFNDVVVSDDIIYKSDEVKEKSTQYIPINENKQNILEEQLKRESGQNIQKILDEQLKRQSGGNYYKLKYMKHKNEYLQLINSYI